MQMVGVLVPAINVALKSGFTVKVKLLVRGLGSQPPASVLVMVNVKLPL